MPPPNVGANAMNWAIRAEFRMFPAPSTWPNFVASTIFTCGPPPAPCPVAQGDPVAGAEAHGVGHTLPLQRAVGVIHLHVRPAACVGPGHQVPGRDDAGVPADALRHDHERVRKTTVLVFDPAVNLVLP